MQSPCIIGTGLCLTTCGTQNNSTDLNKLEVFKNNDFDKKAMLSTFIDVHWPIVLTFGHAIGTFQTNNKKSEYQNWYG